MEVCRKIRRGTWGEVTAVKRGGIPTPVGIGKEKVEERIDLKGEQVSQKEKLTFSERKELGVRVLIAR